MSIATEQLISALVALTQEEKISWSLSGPRRGILFDEGIVNGHVYESNINGKEVLLFRYTYEYSDEFERIQRDYSFRLTVLDGGGVSETEIDDKYSLWTLYDIVRESCHNVAEWADEVIKSAKKING